MERVISNLKQWIIRFLKNNDLIFKRILGIEECAYSIKIRYKDKEQEIFIVPVLDDKFDIGRTKEGHKSIVTVNNRANLDFVVKHWAEFIENRNLSLYFVNPFSTTEKKWVVFPYTHDMVAEGEKIREGLMALYANVEPISIEEYKKIMDSD